MILSGSALFPQYAPDALILTSTSCNLEKLVAHNKGAPASPLSISPHTVVGQMPKHVKIVALNGKNDEPPPLMQDCVDILKGVGADVTFLRPDSNHGSTTSTPEYRASLMAILESEPPSTIVATKPSSPSSGLISTSAQVPAK